MSYGVCIRCGMCCIVAPCDFSEMDGEGDCLHLSVSDDNTTTCHSDGAKKAFVENGSGCLFQSTWMAEMYEIHMSEHRVNGRKEELKRRCHGNRDSRN